jgi:hypothetical protein
MIEIIVTAAALLLLLVVVYFLLNSKLNAKSEEINTQIKFLETEVVGVKRGMQDQFIDKGAYEVEKGDLAYKFNTIEDTLAQVRQVVSKNQGSLQSDARQVKAAIKGLKRLEKKMKRIGSQKATGVPKKTKEARKKKLVKTRAARKGK